MTITIPPAPSQRVEIRQGRRVPPEMRSPDGSLNEFMAEAARRRRESDDRHQVCSRQS